MNILIICNSYPTPKNPHHQIFIKNMKEGMEKLDGVNVDVCYNRVYDFWEGANKRKGLIASIIKYSVFIYSIFYFLLKNSNKIDVIFPQAIVFPTVFASYLKKIYDIPMVAYVHGGDVNAYPAASDTYKSIMRKALSNCDSVIVNSKDLYQKVLRIFSHPDVNIISPGVDIKTMRKLSDKKQLRESFNLPQDKFLLLAVGNAIKRKGFDVLLNALVDLDISNLHDIFVLIITEGPERKNLENFIEVNHLNSYVRIIDKVNQKKLNEYYNTADIFIFPSREEPLGLVGLEAMAAGVPVIGTNIGGIPDYLIHKYNGLLFEAGDNIDLSAKISELINNSDLYRELCANAHIYPEKYSITEAAKKMEKIFLKLASK